MILGDLDRRFVLKRKDLAGCLWKSTRKTFFGISEEVYENKGQKSGHFDLSEDVVEKPPLIFRPNRLYENVAENK
jgi:hypothetical protein